MKHVSMDGLDVSWPARLLDNDADRKATAPVLSTTREAIRQGSAGRLRGRRGTSPCRRYPAPTR
jgi:hypothetical protein